MKTKPFRFLVGACLLAAFAGELHSQTTKSPGLIPFGEHDKKFGQRQSRSRQKKPKSSSRGGSSQNANRWFVFFEGHLIRNPNESLKSYADGAVEKQAEIFNEEDNLAEDEAFYVLEEATYNLAFGNYAYGFFGEVRYLPRTVGIGFRGGYSVWTDIRTYGVSDFFRGFILNARYLSLIPMEATLYLDFPLLLGERRRLDLLLGAGAGTYLGNFYYVAQHSFGSDEVLYEVQTQFAPFANVTYHFLGELSSLVRRFGSVGLYVNVGFRYQVAEDLRFIRDSDNEILTEPENRSSLRIGMDGYSVLFKIGLGF